MIKTSLIGFIGRDAIVNNVNGKNVINFSVAHSATYKDREGTQKTKTTWVDCAYWTDRIGVAPYLTAGTQVFVEGIPDASVYIKEGKPIPSLTLRVSILQLLNKKDSAAIPGNTSGEATPDYGSANDLEQPEEPLPF